MPDVLASPITNIEYRGERGVLPVVTNGLDMHEFVASRLEPGLDKLMAEVPAELTEFAGFAITSYTEPENRLQNMFPEATEAFAGSLILMGAGVNRKTSAWTQDIWVTKHECLDDMCEPSFTWFEYDHKGACVWTQDTFESGGWVIGPVVRTNDINGVYIPEPTDQYPGINFKVEHAVFVPGHTLLEWLKDKYPVLHEGYGVTNRSIASLLLEDFGLVSKDRTFMDWYVEFQYWAMNQKGIKPYEPKPSSTIAR